HVLQRPRVLRRREVGVEHEAGDVADLLLVALIPEALALISGAAVLPDDRGRDGFEGATVPQDEGLALVGDPDRRDVHWFRIRGVQRTLGAGLHRGPDLVGVVLDPAWSRVVLRDLLVTLAAYVAVQSDGHGRRACRPLVEAENYLACQVRFSRPLSYPSRSAATNL